MQPYINLVRRGTIGYRVAAVRYNGEIVFENRFDLDLPIAVRIAHKWNQLRANCQYIPEPDRSKLVKRFQNR